MDTKLKVNDRVVDHSLTSYGAATVIKTRPSLFDDGREDVQVYWDSDKAEGMPRDEAATSEIWWPAHMFGPETTDGAREPDRDPSAPDNAANAAMAAVAGSAEASAELEKLLGELEGGGPAPADFDTEGDDDFGPDCDDCDYNEDESEDAPSDDDEDPC